MDTSETLIRKIRAKFGDRALTDYRLAKLLQMSPQGIHSWKSRGSVFDDKAGQRIAELLDMDPAYVLSCLAAERAKDPSAKKTYERIARVFQYAARTAAAVIMGVVVFQLVTSEFMAMYIMSNYAFIVSLGLIIVIAVRFYRVNLKHFLMQEA